MRYFIAILFLLPVICTNAQKNSRPNIIFIFADDLGYGDIGCYGQQKIETPNIDKLAQKGMKFTQFYSGSTVCAPSRSSFLTGLHTGHTAIRGNVSYPPEGQTPIPDSVITFANLLQQNGYATAAFGKWGLGYITTSGDPNKKGFDLFYGYNCQTLAHNYYPDHLWNNHDRIDFAAKDSVYSADIIHQQALQYLKSTGDKPFFMYLPYTIPHGEVIVPHDSIYYYYIKKFNEQLVAEKRMYDGRPLGEYLHASFAAMIARLDRYVGEIVKLVEEKGIANNTLIIFTSDNGPHKEGGGDPEFFNSNGIYKGIKRDLYEGGIRVPFIAYWPGKIKSSVIDKPAALWDIYPTFLQMAGIQVNKRIDGISLVPTLFQTGKQKQHDFFYWEFHENDGRQAVRWGKWKAVKLKVTKISDPAIELYDLEKDPQEIHNVATQNLEIVKKMAALFSKEHQYNPDWPLLFKEINK
ncbi:MAG TPA: arylsulfatase [Chitinophagaceae bacterium]|jgi:arylsulfatase A-like enzyme|nr:arylsulfatase [Chitinophagaceae bacterium]